MSLHTALPARASLGNQEAEKPIGKVGGVLGEGGMVASREMLRRRGCFQHAQPWRCQDG